MTGAEATAVSALAPASTSPLARRHSNIPKSCGPRNSSSRCVVASLLLRTLSLGPVTGSRPAWTYQLGLALDRLDALLVEVAAGPRRIFGSAGRAIIVASPRNRG